MATLVRDWGNNQVWLINTNGIATYMKTNGDINMALLLGANDDRNAYDGNPFLRIAPSAPTAR